MMNQNLTLVEPSDPDVEQVELRQLLRNIANGDRQAFAAMHQQFSGLVYAAALQILHSQEDAEDVSQEVFACIWAKASLYCSERGKPSTWITTLARNRAIDRIRSRDRRQRLNSGYQQESEVLKGWKAPSPAHETTVKELAHQARSAVMQLSDEQRLVIQLAFFEGLSQLEIAQKIGTPLGTVKARIRRGLGRLRGLMDFLN